MNPRSIWTIAAAVVVLAIVLLGYRMMIERRMTAAIPGTSTEQTGSTRPIAPPTGTPAPTETKPPVGTQPSN